MTILSMCNNSWWVNVNKFSVWRVFRVQVGHSWTHRGLLAALCQQQQKCGEVGSAVFHAPAVWHKPVPPLLCLPGCIMFLWQTEWLWLKGQRQRQTDWKDKANQRGIERDRERGGGGRERAGGVEWGSPASLSQGFPPSHLGCVNPRLAQAHSWILTSPLSRSPCPHSTSPPPPSSLPAQTMNKRACLHAAEKRAVPSRGETLPGDRCQQQQGAGFYVKAGNWSCIYLHCKPYADKGDFTASSFSLYSSTNYSSYYWDPQWTSHLSVVKQH